jgi:hypothetical protein
MEFQNQIRWRVYSWWQYSVRNLARERKSEAENRYIRPGRRHEFSPAKSINGEDNMNNREFDRVSQKDREFEELLCLSYLFTHAGYVESPEESELPLADNVDLNPHHSCN